MVFKPKIKHDSEAESVFDVGFSPIKNREQVMKDTGMLVSSRKEYRENFGRSFSGKCIQLWTNPQINWDGKVLGCCDNLWQDFGGNAFKDGLMNCLNSKNMNYAREMLLGRVPPKEGVPCSRCGVYKQMTEGKEWMKTVDIKYGKWLSLAIRVSYTRKREILKSALNKIKRRF